MSYQTIVDNTTTAWTTYICKADLWKWTDEATWQITNVDASWNVTYPANDNNFPSDRFEFVADDRATYTYSYTWV